MNQPGYASLVLPYDCCNWRCTNFIEHKNRMDMIRHDYKFIDLTFGKMLWYGLHTTLRNDAQVI